MSLIIVEGPDGSGKTTLAKRVTAIARCKAAVSRHGAYPGEEIIALRYLKDVMWAVDHPRELLVMDRSWISEPIYGAAARGGACRVSDNERYVIEQAALTCGAAVVLCLPPFEACRASWVARLAGEYVKKEAQLRAVWDGYAAWASLGHCPLPVVVYDYTKAPIP